MIKDKKMFFIVEILIISLLLFFLIQFVYKTIISGNNINKSTDDLIENILNISSYEAKLEVTVNSNKTSNKYVLEQYYMKSCYSKQIVKEPMNLENLEIVYDGNKLEIKNTNLGLSKIYENYKYLNENILWLNFFINICIDSGYTVEETEEEIILNCNIEKYKYKGKLYIDRESYLPSKIEIIDNNNCNKIYIEYKEIKLNNIQESNIFAFNIESIKEKSIIFNY